MNIDEIRSSIKDMSKEVLVDALALLCSEQKGSEQTVGKPSLARGEFSNFAQAILFLKKNYTFSELDSFVVEADLVYVQTTDRKILLTEKDEMPLTRRVEEQSFFENEMPQSDMEVKSDDVEPFSNEGDTGRFSNIELT